MKFIIELTHNIKKNKVHINVGVSFLDEWSKNHLSKHLDLLKIFFLIGSN